MDFSLTLFLFDVVSFIDPEKIFFRHTNLLGDKNIVIPVINDLFYYDFTRKCLICGIKSSVFVKKKSYLYNKKQRENKQKVERMLNVFF